MLSETFGSGYFATAYRDYSAQNPPRKLDFYRWLLDRYAPGGGRLLDLGCAFGDFLSRLGPQWQRCGVDLSEYALRQSREAAVVANCAALPFAGPFDAITAFDVLEHVPDIESVGRCLQSALRPGGVFLMTVPVYDGPLGWVARSLDGDRTHVHKQGRRWWLYWLARHLEGPAAPSNRFAVEEWWGIFRYLLFGHYFHWVIRGLRSIAPTIVVVARRAT